MVKLKPGHFMVNGVNSWSENGLKVLIQDRPEIRTPRRKREFKSPLGVSGDLVFDEEAYEPTSMTLQLLIEGATEQEVINNRDKLYMLFDSPGYVKFIPYFDPNKEYHVICTDPPVFTNKWWYQGNQTAELELTVQPYKYYTDVIDHVLSNSGSGWGSTISSWVYGTSATPELTINNQYSVPSQPLIHIEGTGDITLKVNGKDYSMKNIEGHIFVDSGMFNSYRKTGNVVTNDNSKVYFKEYPILKPGNNTIGFTGNVAKITVSPRWRSLT